MREVVQILRATLPASIRIELDVDPECRPVWADPHHLHQVVLNLATNAEHAMNGSGVLRLSVAPTEAPVAAATGAEGREWVALTVEDDGAGMDTATIARVFEPFFTTKELGRGTGLGLAVVHGIVASHGGTIQVESEPGAGAQFRICLPASRRVHSGPGLERIDRRGRREGRPESRVLVVDDDHLVAETACRTLVLAGIEAVAASGAREALGMVVEYRDSWSALVVDQAMSGRTGLELLADLHNRGISVPVILITEAPSPISRPRARAAGVSDLLEKPFTGEQLVRSVRAALVAASSDRGRRWRVRSR
jgi:CheY-like chemotaxis protein